MLLGGGGPIVKNSQRTTRSVILQNYEIENILDDLETGEGVKRTPAYECKRSPEQLERWREEFWETRTQGSGEVWMVIRRAIESSPEDAAAFLKAADLTTYTGSLVLWLDRNKVPYRVPVYIINDPVKFWPNEEERLALVEKPEEIEFKDIKIRSAGEKDKIYNLSNYMLVQELLDKYLKEMEFEKHKSLLLYDGRVMKNELPLYYFRLSDEMVIQAMIIREKQEE